MIFYNVSISTSGRYNLYIEVCSESTILLSVVWSGLIFGLSPPQRPLSCCLDSRLVVGRLGRGKKRKLAGNAGNALSLFPSSPALPHSQYQFPIESLCGGVRYYGGFYTAVNRCIRNKKQN